MEPLVVPLSVILIAWISDRARGRPDALCGVCIKATGPLAQHFADLAKGRLGAVSIINPARLDACLLAS